LHGFQPREQAGGEAGGGGIAEDFM